MIIETELLHALYNMIGKGKTGFYKHLCENRDQMEEVIVEYINYLKGSYYGIFPTAKS